MEEDQKYVIPDLRISFGIRKVSFLPVLGCK